MPKSLLEQLPKIVADGKAQAEKILKGLEDHYRVALQTCEWLPSRDAAATNYGDTAKASAERENVALYSMDDEELFGKQLYVITFSEAVRRGLLVDYKVIVLSIEEAHVSRRIVNDANDWAIETMHNSRYPLELFLRVITVSLETMKIVRALPPLDIGEN